MPIYAKVTAYKGKLIFELVADKSIKDAVATSLDTPTSLGQVIMNSAQHLGVSEEALALLKTIKPGRDAIGDVDWFPASNGDAFAWLGGPYSIKTPAQCVGSRDYRILKHVVIPNEPPQGAVDAIDNPAPDEDGQT